MFPYFGNKSRIAHLYQRPAHQRVIEPFAGSARYSLLYWDRDVWLNDINPTICRIWTYLKQASRQDIKALPELEAGEDLREFEQLSVVERELLGFAVSFPRQTPGYTCTSICGRDNRCRQLKQRILQNLSHIRHWKITCLHYADLPDEKATWFVDPPYQNALVPYRYNCVTDYGRLARWCRSRKGRVIVCEERGARWLPFEPFTAQITTKGTWTEEMVWLRDQE